MNKKKLDTRDAYMRHRSSLLIKACGCARLCCAFSLQCARVCKNTNCRDGEIYNPATDECDYTSFCITQANKSVTCGDHATCYHDRDMADHECKCDDIDGLVPVDNYHCACKSPLVFKNETCINPLNASEPAATDNKNIIVGASIGGVLVVAIIGYVLKIRKNRDNSDESSSQVPLLGETTLARL